MSEYEWRIVSTDEMTRVKWLATQTVTLSHCEIVHILLTAPMRTVQFSRFCRLMRSTFALM